MTTLLNHCDGGFCYGVVLINRTYQYDFRRGVLDRVVERALLSQRSLMRGSMTYEVIPLVVLLAILLLAGLTLIVDAIRRALREK